MIVASIHHGHLDRPAPEQAGRRQPTEAAADDDHSVRGASGVDQIPRSVRGLPASARSPVCPSWLVLTPSVSTGEVQQPCGHGCSECVLAVNVPAQLALDRIGWRPEGLLIPVVLVGVCQREPGPRLSSNAELFPM